MSAMRVVEDGWLFRVLVVPDGSGTYYVRNSRYYEDIAAGRRKPGLTSDCDLRRWRSRDAAAWIAKQTRIPQW